MKISAQDNNSVAEGSVADENVINGAALSVSNDYSVFPAEGETPASAQTITLNTDLYEIQFSTLGGDITSLKLKEHVGEDGEQVNMVYPVTENRAAFEISFGENYSHPLRDAFYYKKVGEYEYHFYQSFVMNYSDGTASAPFTITKKYRFVPNEYMMEMTVEMVNSVNEYIPLNYDGISYTLTYGPQIGPSFEKLDGRYYFRQFQTYKNDKVELQNRGAKKNQYVVDEYVNWAPSAVNNSP